LNERSLLAAHFQFAEKLVEEMIFLDEGGASGESRAITHTDRGFIDRVIHAINSAIVARG